MSSNSGSQARNTTTGALSSKLSSKLRRALFPFRRSAFNLAAMLGDFLQKASDIEGEAVQFRV